MKKIFLINLSCIDRTLHLFVYQVYSNFFKSSFFFLCKNFDGCIQIDLIADRSLIEKMLKSFCIFALIPERCRSLSFFIELIVCSALDVLPGSTKKNASTAALWKTVSQIFSLMKLKYFSEFVRCINS